MKTSLAPATPIWTSRSASLEIVEIDEDHVTAVDKNVILAVWARRTLPEAYRRLGALVRDLRSSYPEGVCVLQVVEVTAVPPEQPVRDVMAELLKVDGIAQFSVVFEATGFKAAAVRAIVHAGQAAARVKFPHSVHQSVGESAEWHAGLKRSLSATELQDDIQKMREQHRSRFPAA